MSLAQIEPAEATRIFSAHGRNRSFLQIRRQGDRVRVEPTLLGKSSLNSFWPAWLEMLIHEKTAHKHGFAVEHYRANVVVSSGTSYDGLHATVAALATDIRPLLNPPLKRWLTQENPKSYAPLEWTLRQRPHQTYVPFALIKERMHLPKGTLLQFEQWLPWYFWPHDKAAFSEYSGMITLWNESAVASKLLAQKVELHFALACCV